MRIVCRHSLLRNLSVSLFVLYVFSSAGQGLMAAEPQAGFEHVTIDPEIGKVCYAVTLADVDGNGHQDIVAVSENRVLWYQAPDWTPHIIIKDQTPLDNVCIAAHDIDGDGQVDFALGAGWTKTGTIHWLNRKDSLDELWNVHMIGEEKSLHRMRFADVLGTGRPQLVLSPLLASTGNGVRLLALEVPAHPDRDRWPEHVLSHDLNRMHNHWHTDLDGDGLVDTLTASREGVHLVHRNREGGWWQVRLGQGIQGENIDSSGAGEVKLGRLKNGRKYIVTVEPMHGHSLAVYTQSTSSTTWNHQVIDSGFKRGHALWCMDMNGDGDEDIVFGHSDTPEVPGVNVYYCANSSGTAWEKQVVDAGGMATEDLVVGDLTGDGLPDIVAGGRATHNVKLYVNKGVQ